MHATGLNRTLQQATVRACLYLPQPSRCTCLRGGCTAALSSTAQAKLDFLLPGELAKHTVSEGTKAFTKFTGAQGTKA